MFGILIHIFLMGFLLNLVWEVIHSQLYTTCYKLPLRKYITLIVGASLKDGFFIALFFILTVFIFGTIEILTNPLQFVTFILFTLVFAFVDEKISIQTRRWEYTRTMPMILGAGISPLFELGITGTFAFICVYLL